MVNYTYTQPNLSAGIDDVIVDIAGTVPIFVPMLLVFIFSTVLIGGLISQKRREGIGDFLLWATLASISTLLVALPLTLTGGIIQLEYLVIVVVITIFSGFWLFTDRNKNEI